MFCNVLNTKNYPIVKPSETRLAACYTNQQISEWPRQWKLRNVSPAHKNDDETSKKNYPPISVLYVTPKVFEKLKFDQLDSVFTPVFSDMSRFLRGHSRCSALFKLTDDWRSALDNKKGRGNGRC